MQQYLLLAPVLLPLLGGLPVFKMNERIPRRRYVTVLLALEVPALLAVDWSGSAVLPVLQLWGGARVVLGADALGRLFALLVAVLWLIVSVFADEYMTHEHNQARFFGFYVTSLGSLIGICLAGNLVTLYLFYEMMTLLTVFLVIHAGNNKAIDAGLKYLGFSVCGAALGLLGMFYLQQFQTTDLFAAGGTLDAAAAAANAGGLRVALLLMLLGFGAKAGVMPLFAWLPTAHPVAPSPASAVLSGLITKMGVLAMIRVIYFQFGGAFLADSWVQTVMLCLAIFTVFMGSMLAYKEKTLKKRLAYSTVSQVSYILFGILLVSPEGFYGGLLQLVFHAIAKNGLFMAAGGIIYHLYKTRVNQLQGAGLKLPYIMWCFALYALSLIGIPPTAGFVSKWYLAQGGLLHGTLGLVGTAVLMVSALLTAGYLLPIVTDAFFHGEDFHAERLHEPQKQHLNWHMRGPMMVLSVSVVLLGIFPHALDFLIEPVMALLFS